MSGGDVRALVAGAIARGVERSDAQRLMSSALDRPRAWLIAHDDHVLDETEQACFASLVARRLDDEPLSYLLGEQEFHGLLFEVDPAVLVPRPDTEWLVDWAIERIVSDRVDALRPLEVVDLGTGSGAIAIAVAVRCPSVAVTAVELSEAALRVAVRNGVRHGVAIDWRRGSWWAPLAGRRFDLALANPPYIASEDPHLPALKHEPRLALVSGADGLDALRAVTRGATAHLRAGAWLLVEHGFDQAVAVQAIFAAAGFDHVQSRPDLQGHLRCTGGQWPT